MAEFRVNTTTAGAQSLLSSSSIPPSAQAVATDDSGNFIVVWVSQGQDDPDVPAGYGVYAQRFTADGTPAGSEFRINTYTTNNQFLPSVAMDADGDFVVTWTSYGQPGDPGDGIYLQRYDRNGNPINTDIDGDGDSDGEFRVNTTTSLNQRASNIAMDADGDFVVTWTGQDGNLTGVVARRYSGGVWGDEFIVNQVTTGNQQFSRIAMADNGNFVITWINGSDATADVYARLYAANGIAITDEFRVNNYTTSGQLEPSVAMDADGDFVISWTSNGQDGSNYGVYARRYNAAGEAQGTTEFRVNTQTPNQQRNPTVAMDGTGGFVITWSSVAQDAGTTWGVYGQRYNAAGNTQGSEFRINDEILGNQQYSSVSMTPTGNYVVAWTSNAPSATPPQDGSGSGIYAETFVGTPNQTPTVSNLGKVLDEDVVTAFTLADFSNAFTDGDNDPLSFIQIITLPTNGVLRLNGTTVLAGQNIPAASLANLTYTPNENYNGTDSFQWNGSDGISLANTPASVSLTINPVNDAPIINPVDSQTTNEDVPLQFVFTIGDVDNPATDLTATATSSNTTLVPNANIVITGTGVDRTIRITPAAELSGSTTITLNVSDGSLTTTQNFSLTVTAVDDPPTITAIADQTIPEDGNTGPLSFTIGDVDTPVENLTLSVDSSDPTLIPVSNIVIGGTGANRTVLVTPAANLSGTATVTLSVNDGTTTITETFSVLVQNVNDPPTITDIGNQAIEENTSTPILNFTIGDVETPVNDLIVTATSSDQTLVPNGNIVLGGTGASRTVQVTPAAGQSGVATITITVFDGERTSIETFNVAVGEIDDPPTITPIGPQTLDEDNSTGELAFTIGDPDTPIGSLTVTATSSNTDLVPNANVVLGGSGANRTITVTPLANLSGTTTITIRVSDGNSETVETFDLTVNSVNDAPTISEITDRTINEDATTGAIAFTVGDVETPAAELTVTATSSNPTLVPAEGIVISGTGANRTISIAPALNQFGTTTITVSVSDGSNITTETFVVTVNSVNDAPTISVIPNQSTTEGTATSPLAFTVGDVETAPDALIVTGTSNDQTLVPNGNIVIGGSGANRTVTVTPAPGQSGIAEITITVNDGETTTTETFNLAVGVVDDPPTISAIADQITDEDFATNPIAFTVGDPDTPLNALTITASSSNTTLIPIANIAIGGSGANRTVTVTPAANLSGNATITVTVSDGTTEVTEDFAVVVNPVNDAPTITPIANRTIDEDTSTGAIAFSIGDVETPAADLVVTATSSNPTLVPNSNVVIGGSGANRTVTVNPVINQFGTATITVSVSDGSLTTERTFVVTVNSINDLPTISTIPTQNTDEGTAITNIPFTIGDVETPAENLTVTASSSDPSIIPNENIVIGGSGANRTVTVTPVANRPGNVTITLNVSDGVGTTTSTFLVEVGEVNDPPTISAIANQTISEDGSTGAISFSIDDVDTPIANLTVTATSSNPALVPDTNVVLTGTGASRAVTVTPLPDQFGETTITLRVSDGNSTTERTFVVNVGAVNDPPTISAIEDQTVEEDTPTTALAFTIGDAETPVGDLVVTATSSNPTLVPNANIVIDGTGANRTVIVTPATDQFGLATITISVSDGTTTSVETFNVTVGAVNDPPFITAIDNQTINESTSTGALAFIVGDAETAVDALVVTATSSNPDLVPNSNIVVSGTGANRTVTVNPIANQSGTAVITLTVNDGTRTATQTFDVVVTTVDDPPTITAVADQTINEDTATETLAFTIGDIDTPVNNLIVTAVSGNPALVPDANITLLGTGANRTVRVTPALNQFGTATITLRVSDGTTTSIETFDVVVTPINDAPTISDIGNQTTPENTPTTAIPFTIADVDSPIDSLTLTATSSNTALIANNNIVISGTGANRTISVTPTANQSGTATITVRVSDGALATTETFEVLVDAVNDPPTIGPISNRTTNEDTPTGAIPFTVGDIDTPATSLTVTATSSNPTLIPNGNISITGTGTNRAINLTPALNQFGTATITVTVSDGNSTASQTFEVLVNAVNDAPTVSAIADQATPEGTATSAIAFTIGDVETPANALTITTSSNNTTLVPNANIVVSGTGADRTVVVTPVANQSGTATISIQVSDGNLTTTETFNLVVNSVNDAPTISAIADLSINEDTASAVIPFTIGDVDTPVGSLTVTATSSNPTLIPVGNIVLAGTGANRTVRVTPAANQNGTATVTLNVSDGTSTTTETFEVNVTPVPDPPTVSPVTKAGTEDGVVTFALADFTAGFNDPDGDALTQIRITSLPTNGTLRLNGTAVTVDQSIPAAQLGTLTFTPNPNFNGSVSFGWTASDGTTFAATPSTVTLNIAAVNDLPTLTNINKTANEDAVITFTVSDFTAAFADIDGDSLVRIQITSLPTNGTLRLAGEAVTLNQQILTAQLNSLTFTPNANFNGAVSFGWNGSDGTTFAATAATVNLTINSVDDAPVVTTTVAPITYAEGDAAIAIDNGLTITDVDSTQLNGATVTLVNFDPSQDVLAFTASGGITGTINGDTLTLTGTANLSDYVTVLRSITYRNSSVSPNTVDRLVRFSVSDTTNVVSNLATRTIQVLPDDTAPIVTPTPGSLGYLENSGAVVIDNSIVLGDSDSVLLNGATVRIVGYTPDSQESLGFIDQNGISGFFDSATGVLTLGGLSALPNYQNALRSITYTNNSDNPPTTRGIQFTVSDDTSNGNVATRTIQIIPVNDAPRMVTNQGIIPYTIGTGAIAVDAEISVTDPDSTTLSGGAIAILDYTPGRGILGFSNQNGITGNFNPATGILTLSGVATVANYQTAFRSVTYSTTTTTTSLQLIQFTASDGVATSNPVTSTLQLAFFNVSPVVDLNGSATGTDATVNGIPGATIPVVDGNLTITDADSPTLSSALVYIDEPIGAMQEELAVNTAGTGLIASYNPDVGVLNITGTADVSLYQQVLRSLTYRNNVANPAAPLRRILVSVHDGRSNSTAATLTLDLSGNSSASGGPGISLVTTPNTDVINAPTTDDTVTSILANLQQNDTINGGAGIDTFVLTDGVGTAIVDARSTTNQITGITPSGTTISNFERFDFAGFGGTVTMIGSDLRDDVFIGGAGNDTLQGGAGNDTLIGNGGNDFYTVDSPGDVVIEAANAGIDTVQSSINFALGANVENLLLIGTAAIGVGNALNNSIAGNEGNNRLLGAAGNDILIGNGGNDRLVGGAGRDRLLGGAGNDRLLGGGGNDRLIGGPGRDRLVGGIGRDIFQFNNRRDGVDVIADFNVRQDRIFISRAGFSRQLRRGRLGADQFALGSSATRESDRFIYNAANGALFFDADGVGGAAQVQIARLANRAAITQANITIFG